jgi:hypothetical protein
MKRKIEKRKKNGKDKFCLRCLAARRKQEEKRRRKRKRL